MRRSLSRAPFRSLTGSFCRSKSGQKGWKNGGERTESSQTSASPEVGIFGGFGVAPCFIHLGFGMNSVTEFLQKQIVNALCLGKRDRASDLLLNLSQSNDSLRADDFAYILDYCARSPDPLFVMETWRTMEGKNIATNRTCNMFIIQALTRGGYLEEAFSWLTALHGSYLTGPISLYNAFLNGCARTQSTVHADYCLDLMEDRLLGKSEVTYCELLKLAVWQQSLSAVHEIWKEFVKHYSPSIISLRKFIWAFTRLGDLVSACESLQRMVNMALHGSFSVKKSAGGKFRLSNLDIPIPSKNDWAKLGELPLSDATVVASNCKNQWFFVQNGSNSSYVEANKGRRSFSIHVDDHESDLYFQNRELVNPVFHWQRGNAETLPTMKILRWSFSDIIHTCAQSKNSKLAEQLFLQMQALGLEPSSHTYDALIRAVVSERGAFEGIQLVKTMENLSMKPYDATLATLSISCSKALELDLAEALLDQIVGTPYIHTFNSLLAACDVMDQPERAVRVLAKMKQFKLKPDIWTYELLFSLFGNVNAPYESGNMFSQVEAAKRINAIERDMMNNGIQHSPLSMTNLVKALGAEGNVREMVEYFRKAGIYFAHSDSSYLWTAFCNVVLHALVECDESHMAIEIFKNMKLHGSPPDAATYNIMIDCCSNIRCFKSACALVSMMLRDGFRPENCTYTALIKILLANEDFDGALYLLDQVMSEGIQEDVLLFNTILLEAYIKGHIDIIEFVVEKMHGKKIQPDPSTCWYVFSAYVDSGFFSTAMEALQVLSLRMISEEERTFQEKRGDYEDGFVLAEDSEAEERIIKTFMDSDEHIAAALLNLRCCALAGFSISWLPSRSLWARRLSATYGGCLKK
ncbi:hypothetical protein Sjap_008504 [Stephania japonica]|uniref:Pentatricopeptide repeat-containing protein n=1 Tax=Stephania japonica TaxID=461633 RepID=A0AAP0JRW8_9MAGN